MNSALACLGVLCVGVGATSGLIGHGPKHHLDFAVDVLPILQRQGCSSAYCHGSATGRAGFKLSLFGSDAAADYAAIATQLGGRRLDLRAPERSLLVQKALGHLDHGGGRRLSRSGAAHETLLQWIAAGAPWRAGEREQLQSLRVSVRDERAVAEASFDVDGDERQQVRDVSDVALFSTSDPTVVDIDTDGRLDSRGAGQAYVMARFGNLTAVVRLVRPFAGTTSLAGVAPSHTLDAAWRAHLAELGLQPTEAVAAAQFARRMYLDLVGRPPTPQELDAFVTTPDVPATVAALGSRREFAEVWGAHLANWFEVPDAGVPGPAAAAAARDRTALVQAIARGDSLPTIARRIALGEVGQLERLSDARDRAEYVGRTLLGKRIGCARCHDHPSDRWARSEHLAFSACFASPRPDGAGGMTAGALFDPEAGERVEPRFLALAPGGAAGPSEDNRRRDVADFLLSRAHDAFARNACNRVFALLFGRGLVEPVDDHRLGNPPLDPGMLDALVDAFHRCEGRLPELLTFVLTSATYAAPPAEQDGPETTYLARRASCALSPATFARAVAAVVGRAPAVQPPDSALARELALRNGPMLHDLLAAGGTTVDATFDLCGTPDERLVELWRTVLSRAPRADEIERFTPSAAERSAFRDLAYALLSGREFGHRR